ncbi:adenylate kinase family protein [Thalassoroseus pseudoceratinae]|uniref:adenylate kinase family protein n=1 Tax=Thalassoroseus pseudoceratinae TaxID=2713176 RepID=UPI001421C5DB|nr:nucleoside monophosphate kinase [Thalassoroseus pseudoceratinae]
MAESEPQKKHPAVLLFGPPGVGKGTQGKILGVIPGFFHLSSGDVFRSLDINSPEAQAALPFISRGELAPDELTMKIWLNGLNGQIATSLYKPYEDLLVLDGIPRSVPQVSLLSAYCDVHRIVELVCSDEEKMIHRIKRRAIREHRLDDANEDVIRRRFEVYRRDSMPVIGEYPPEIVTSVDAMRSPAEVLRSVLEVLVPVQNEHFQSSRRS